MRGGGEPVTIDFLGLDAANKNAREKCAGDVHNLSWIKPHMMRKVLSMKGFSEPKHQAKQTPITDTHSPTPITQTHSPVSDSGSETTKLTIFYQGKVNVYNVSADKAKSIFKLAGAENSNNFASMRRKGEGGLSSEIKDSDRRSQSFTGTAMEQTQIRKLRSDLPLARKQSLQRFLEKRKHRLMMAAPYSHEAEEGQP